MFQNIILLVLVILLLFFISNERKFNDLISKNNVKYLFLLVVVYFIYQNYNLILLIVALLIVIYFNVDFSEKFNNNKYLGFLTNLKETFSNFQFEDEINNDFEIQNNSVDNDNTNHKKQNIEPFKEKVTEIKSLFENIKMEMQKIV
jgi:hypothetical protein